MVWNLKDFLNLLSDDFTPKEQGRVKQAIYAFQRTDS